MQYTASALYGLGISNGIYSIYDIIANGGKKLFYQSSTEEKQQELIWGNPDLTVSSSIDSNTVGILNLVYHFVNLPFNVAFMILTLLSLDGWDETSIYWVQIASFVNILVSGVSWLSLSLIPYVVFYFGDNSSVS